MNEDRVTILINIFIMVTENIVNIVPPWDQLYEPPQASMSLFRVALNLVWAVFVAGLSCWRYVPLQVTSL